MVTNDADFDPAPLGEPNLKCEEFYRLLFPSCSHSASFRSPRFLPARSSWPRQPKCLRDKQFWRISDRSNRPERIQNNIHALACSPLRKASSCIERFCIVALMLLLPAPKFKPGGSASAASRTRPMHRARGRSRQNINTCTCGARTHSRHKQAI
jgi:hypothetical protein